ncbi:transposon Tf2-6 polyprotein [Nephila pilipes]|uniref:Transposon Tf2-6 polyprotein n=1 Tax=Nephila pilipes TaxID=299642 RepID=A0A8X6Q793_NEPPI|nr:transposon Tf2-6 polyprotein [Nephila pilipes]
MARFGFYVMDFYFRLLTPKSSCDKRPSLLLNEIRYLAPANMEDVILQTLRLQRDKRLSCACQGSSSKALKTSFIKKGFWSELGNYSIPSAQFSHIHIDVVGPFSSIQGMSYLLTYVDRFTRWTEAFPFPDQVSDTIARAFLYGWVARIGGS